MAAALAYRRHVPEVPEAPEAPRPELPLRPEQPAERSAGNAYVKVQKFTDGLHALGMVAIEQLDDRHSVTITRKIVKYLRSNSAVH